MEALKPPMPDGCLVLLKSGGPLMTTETVRLDSIVPVVWFSADGMCQRDAFHIDALVIVGMPPKPRDEMWDIAKEAQAQRQADEDIANASRE